MKPSASAPLDITAILKTVKDSRRDGLYDRVLLKSGSPTPREIVCFQRPVGPLVSWTETNMLRRGELQPPLDAIIQRFLFLFQPTCSDTDVAALLRNYIWEFWILQKVMQRAPVLVCAAKGSMKELIEGFGHEDCTGKVRPYARPFSFFLGDRQLYIPPLTPFSLKLIGEPITPEHDLDFYAIADGTIDRPLQ